MSLCAAAPPDEEEPVQSRKAESPRRESVTWIGRSFVNRLISRGRPRFGLLRVFSVQLLVLRRVKEPVAVNSPPFTASEAIGA